MCFVVFLLDYFCQVNGVALSGVWCVFHEFRPLVRIVVLIISKGRCGMQWKSVRYLCFLLSEFETVFSPAVETCHKSSAMCLIA